VAQFVGYEVAQLMRRSGGTVGEETWWLNLWGVEVAQLVRRCGGSICGG
jgi:hypothetical protein